MFLTELRSEEKEAFLELAAYVAKVDGNVSVFESTILAKYRKEMDLEEYQIKGLGIEEVLNCFTTERSKNIILTELLQLIFADGVYHDRESEIVRVIKKHFGFEAGEFSSFKDWVDKIKELSMLKVEQL